jgi:hypothetical protein
LKWRCHPASVGPATIGVTGGEVLALAGERPMPVKALAERFEAWLPRYMAGGL